MLQDCRFLREVAPSGGFATFQDDRLAHPGQSAMIQSGDEPPQILWSKGTVARQALRDRRVSRVLSTLIPERRRHHRRDPLSNARSPLAVAVESTAGG